MTPNKLDSKASHTPGPWLFCDDSGPDRNIWAETKLIAKVDGNEVDCDTADSNACLIAEAPNLLHALMTISEMSSVIPDDKYFREFAVSMCQIAIAKATNLKEQFHCTGPFDPTRESDTAG